MTRCKIRRAAIGLALMTGACSDDSAEEDAGSGTTAGLSSTGTGGGSSSGTTSGTTSAGPTSDASSSTSTASEDPSTGSGESSELASGSGGESGSGSDSSGEGSTNLGACGLRGQALVFSDSYEGWEEYYLKGDEGLGDELCVVRFTVRRVGDAAPGCTDCLWTHEVEYSDPQVLLDTDGVCARSELGLDEAAIAEIPGQRHGYGYVYEYFGHASYLMLYDVNSSAWRGRHYASWDDELGDLLFDHRLGACSY